MHGIVRRSSSLNTNRIDHLYNDSNLIDKRLFLHYGDLTDGVGLSNLLHSIKPTEIYNLAAQSHVQVSFEVPEYTGLVDGLSSIKLLEIIRQVTPETKFYQASSSELYGVTISPQNELSEMKPQSPYAVAKLYSYWITKVYREAYGIFAVNGILFNHESHRRGPTFVTKKIVNAAVQIKNKKQDRISLGNLTAMRDWGWAPEYVLAMWQMMQREKPDDLVVGTGVSASVSDFGRVVFSCLGLNFDDHLVKNDKYLRKLEVPDLRADTKKMKSALGWSPSLQWSDLASLMVEQQLIDKVDNVNWTELINRSKLL